MQGLGNDFVVVAGPVELSGDDVVSWCDRRRGIGADGVLEVTPIDHKTVRMRYWNADGGTAEMCGNGLRCVARFAANRGWVEGDSFSVQTAVGRRQVRINQDGSVSAFLGKATAHGEVDIDGIVVHTVEIGNPHAVLWVDDPENAHVGEVGPRIEKAPSFPAGSNAEFARVVARDQIELRVWERGVGETLACGTGAAATAFLANRQGLVGADVAVNLLGGTLRVILEDDGVWIEGPAVTVFSGTL